MSWLLWYGLKLGLDYFTAQNLPLAELIDLASIEKIKVEGARLKGADCSEGQSDEDIIPKDLR